MDIKTREKIEALLTKAGFIKITGKEVYFQGKVPHQKIVDMSGDGEPWVGISTGTQRQSASECGIAQVTDYQNMIHELYISSEPKIKDPVQEIVKIYKCKDCGTEISKEQAEKSFKKNDKALCEKCAEPKEKPAPKPKAPSKEDGRVEEIDPDTGMPVGYCGNAKHLEKEKAKDTQTEEHKTKEPDVKENKKEEKKKSMDKKEAGANVPAILNKEPDSLSLEIIQQYICPAATNVEAYNFLQLCLKRDLNPFLKEAYLIKYGNQPATMVVGKDAFTRKAEESGQFDGFEAGIMVVDKDKQLVRREGVVQIEGDKLVGGWAKVHRKDMKYPFVCEVPLTEYVKMKDGKPMSSWATMPGTMIRKVALVQALREGFTKELGGCYDAAELLDKEMK